jgi:hypothetical protein
VSDANVERIARALDAAEAGDRAELYRLVEASVHPIYEFEGGLMRRGRVYRSHAETIAAAEELARA